MIQVCRECDDETSEAVAVGIEHAASVGGRIIYLCRVCRFVMRVMPLSGHPPDSLGYVRYEEEAVS